ncbi:MAG: hypothetical protein O3B64_01840 [bacterium]|nr:hypothetical protein [bacterium]
MSFDAPATIERMIKDAVQVVPRLSHIRPDQVLVFIKKGGVRTHGKLTPLRHAYDGTTFRPMFPTFHYQHRDIIYLLQLNAGLLVENHGLRGELLETLMHELWHMAPAFDGKARRMPHGRVFNTNVADCVQEYRSQNGFEPKACSKEEMLQLRYLKQGVNPGVLRVRKGVNVSRAIEGAHWRSTFSEDDIIHRSTRAHRVLPKQHRYRCPNGHMVTTGRRFYDQRSCTACSPRFSSRYVLRYEGSTDHRSLLS